MRRYRIGILGSGVISRTYLADIHPELEIVACADIDRALSQKLADEFGIPKAYVTQELLESYPKE